LIFPFAETIAWCLMPNHFHFMIYTDERCSKKIKQGGIVIDPVTNGFRKLLSSYARIFNDKYEKSGSLFRQKTKSKCLSEIKINPETEITVFDYYINCFHYIHQNPLRAKLVSRLEVWEFSSFKDFAALRSGTLCNRELAIKFCNFEPSSFLQLSYEMISEDFISYFA
jgi:putative transposase